MKHEDDRIALLDHGYLRLVESWGDDEGIVETARMSTRKGFLGWGPKHAPSCPYDSHEAARGNASADCNCREDTPGDEKLLGFMWNNQHSTPFEFAGVIIEVKAPVMVFREWHRHRTWSFSEASARYSPMPDENYVPSVERMLVVSKTNKQAGAMAGSAELHEAAAHSWRKDLMAAYAEVEAVYQIGLTVGVPKEVARMIVPVGRYSVMRATANLRNVLAFLKLRSAPNAQWEIRQYSDALAQIVARRFPRTWDVAKGSLGL